MLPRYVYSAFLLMLLVALPGLATADDIGKAKALFKQYVALESAYDPAVASLYAQDAVIKSKRIYPTGQVRELTMPAAQYKSLIRTAMPLAKMRGDSSTYSGSSFTQEGPECSHPGQSLFRVETVFKPYFHLGRPGFFRRVGDT